MATAAATKPKPATKAATNGERKGPDFTIKPVTALVEVDGVEVPAPNHGTTRRSEELMANLVALQENPNQWFEVAHYAARAGSEAKPGGARKVVANFMEGKVTAPEADGEYDMDWRDANYDGSARKGSVVIACYILTD